MAYGLKRNKMAALERNKGPMKKKSTKKKQGYKDLSLIHISEPTRPY